MSNDDQEKIRNLNIEIRNISEGMEIGKTGLFTNGVASGLGISVLWKIVSDFDIRISDFSGGRFALRGVGDWLWCAPFPRCRKFSSKPMDAR